MSLTSGQTQPGVIEGNGQLNFEMSTTNGLNGLRLEIAGNVNMGNQQVLSVVPPSQLQQFSGSNLIMSSTQDFDGSQTTGFICPNVFSGGEQVNLLLENNSPSQEGYLVRATNYDNTLNNGNQINGELCCRGEGNLIVTQEPFRYDIPIGVESVTFRVLISTQNQQVENFPPELLARHGDCPSSRFSPAYEYNLDIEFNVEMDLTISTMSTPPLQPGQTLYLSLARPLSVIGDAPEVYSITSCEGNGCIPEFTSETGTTGLTESSRAGRLAVYSVMFVTVLIAFFTF